MQDRKAWTGPAQAGRVPADLQEATSHRPSEEGRALPVPPRALKHQ